MEMKQQLVQMKFVVSKQAFERRPESMADTIYLPL